MVLVETVVSALLSALFNVLFDRMATRQVVDFFRTRFKSSDGSFNGTDLLESLKTKLLIVNVVLSDAEEKQITNPFVKEWVDELKNVVYQAEDLLDEIATLALALAEVRSSKSVANNYFDTLKSRLEGIISKLENIAKHKDVLGLKESFGGKLYQRLPTTSLVDECKVYGRNKDKEKIMDFVLSDRENGTEVPVIAIAGMAGVGKTTLAQLLYNDSRVKKRFRTRAWAYVSEEFDVFKVTKTIYESVTSRDCNITDLNLIQIRLKEELGGKKFLLVLDDVWNENFISWDFLQNSFKDGAKGSRIIVTTRSHSVASTMGATLTHSLQQLSEIDCRSVFETHAFRSKNSQIHPELKRIGENVVEKCHGLPLAAKIIGSLLHSKVEAHEWDNILNSKIWDLQSHKSNILPSLRLSYYHLPSHLKQCFAYCSIFPKRFVFEKEKLVMLWMADGLLQRQRGEKCMEEVGNRYFDELVSMSLFQKNGDKPGFVMHDLVNELAQFVSGEFCFNFESGKSPGISEKTRHFSYARNLCGVVQKFEALTEAKFLRTFLPLGPSSKSSGSNYVNPSIFEKDLPNLICLRALSLSDYKITEFPDIFGMLKHLRFLDLSRTEIKALPKSTCSLYNLQTLMLSDCTKLMEMPPEFGRLKNLQILTTFVVSNSTGASSISELGGLLHLRDKLSISELQNVQDSTDAENAKLKDKEYVKEFAFCWNNNGFDQQRETDVLEKLRPRKNIEKISIQGYNGTKLPDWLGDPSFDHMVILRISDCKNCSSFPPLEQLSSLQELRIKKCPKLDGKLPYDFPSLELLYIDQCCKLNFPSDDIKGYRNLQDLQIKNSCHLLKKITLSFFNKLKHFEIQDCRKLNCIEVFNDLHQELKFLQRFEISNCNDLKAFSGGRMHSPNLTSFSVSNCNSLGSMPEHMHTPKLTSFSVSNCNSLQSLPKHIRTPKLTSNCNGFQSMPKHMHTPKLISFWVSNCNSLRSMPERMHAPDLTSFSVSECNSLQSMPEYMRAPKLTSFSISNCNSLQQMPEHMNMLFTSLESLVISCCPKLESFPNGGLPTNLKTLLLEKCSCPIVHNDLGLNNMALLTRLTIIGGCSKLESFPDEGLLPASLTFIKISEFPHLETLNLKGLQDLALLKDLQINSCDILRYFSEDGMLPSSLSSLSITGHPRLQLMPEHMNTPNLTSFSILNCNSLQSMPRQMHAPKLTSFSISNCNSLQQMPEQMNMLFTSLESLVISCCPKLESFPNGGLPTNLKTLLLEKCDRLTVHNDWGLNKMALLTGLMIIGGCSKLESFPDKGLLPASLESIKISEFPVLETLNLKGLQDLALLKDLQINSCDSLRSFSVDGKLPSSLSSLNITGHSCLTQLCQKGVGEYWPKIRHIKNREINGKI